VVLTSLPSLHSIPFTSTLHTVLDDLYITSTHLVLFLSTPSTPTQHQTRWAVKVSPLLDMRKEKKLNKALVISSRHTTSSIPQT